MLRLRAITLLLAAFFAASLSFAAPNFPPLTGRVVDAAGILNSDAKTILENRLRDYQDQSGHQVAVATVPSLEGYDIRDYGNQLFRKYALGDKTKNDGVLVLVAPAEHKVSIEVGYGLEGDLTDAMSRIIIENAMIPRFKTGDWAGGLYAGLDDIQKVVGGQGDEVVKRVESQSAGNPDDIIPVIIFFIFVLIIVFNASRGGRGIFIPGSGGGFGGGGFSGGGGGGGFSGGGGSSGGGGASGGW
ncbi:MAG: TPM domain-containing protein [Aestuariivirga sp.]